MNVQKSVNGPRLVVCFIRILVGHGYSCGDDYHLWRLILVPGDHIFIPDSVFIYGAGLAYTD